MDQHSKTERPKRRTVSFQQASKLQGVYPLQEVRIVHADERSVRTRFSCQIGSKLLCATERLERSEEVAFEEGWRELKTQNQKARAAYSIDWLYDGCFFVAVHVEYDTGDCSGSRTYEVFSTRKECVEYFLERARTHFGSNRSMPDGQCQARRQMQELLEPSLFGFIEPTPLR